MMCVRVRGIECDPLVVVAMVGSRGGGAFALEVRSPPGGMLVWSTQLSV